MAVNHQAPQKRQVTFGKFANLDIRVARVISARPAEGMRFPSRVFELDLGHLGTRTSVGQFSLVPQEQLVGRNLVACVNLGTREMGQYLSEVLVLGVRHPESPDDQAQATPLHAPDAATPGDPIF